MEKELNYYYQTSWETRNEQNDPFESALSSMVSSPTTGGGGDLILGGNDHGMMMELIGRLGCISESTTDQLSCIATTTANNSTNTSCYTTPLNSPPKFSSSTSYMLMYGGGDGGDAGGGGVSLPEYPPGFVERAAKFSSYGLNRGVGVGGSVVRSGADLECGKLSRVSSSQSMMRGGDGKFGKVWTPENGDVGDSREGSSVSDQNLVGQMGLIDVNSRKRKYLSKSKAKDNDNKMEQENEKANGKRSKINGEEGKKQNEDDCNATTTTTTNQDKQNDSKEVAKAEPPKDYIHVRARRGQATDSHSLAERVRREKINERMKFLQGLVPGCNKVTGKAIVLEEIINYVQSLQRQVEFLSMKLSTFNPTTEFNSESFLFKDMFQSKGLLSTMPQIMYQLEQNSGEEFPHGYQPFQQLHSPLANIVPNGNENPFSLNPSNVAGVRRHLAAQLPSSITQMPNFCEDDLQSIVQMGIVENDTQSIPGTSPNAQMKVDQ